VTRADRSKVAPRSARTSSASPFANRAAVVDVPRKGQATRAELCQLTGLSRSTVSSLVGGLTKRGLVAERATAVMSSSCRPPPVVMLDRSAGLGIGIDIGVRHLAVAVGDLSRTVHAERWWPEPAGHSAPDGIPTVVSSVDTVLREAGAEREQLIGAAVSVAAPIFTQNGSIAEPRVLPGWTGARMTDALCEALRIPVVVDLDRSARHLGRGLAGLVNTVNPRHIVIEGELPGLSDLLLDPLRDELRRLSFVAWAGGVQVRSSSLGERASLLGALAVVLTRPSRFADGSALAGLPTRQLIHIEE
jgi:hypothetical protein